MFAKSLPPSPAPKISLDAFDPMGNYFIVRQNRRYHYFPVKVEKHPPNAPMPILKFEKAPPVLMEGWVVTQKRVYLVTVEDLLRGIVRTSNEYRFDKEKSSAVAESNTTTGSGAATRSGESSTGAKPAPKSSGVSASTYGGDIRNLVEPGTLESIGLESHAALDRLVSEQEQALHSLEDSEEER
jgi:hypothetical protein